MTPQTALGELLARLAANRGAAVYVSDDELAGWPHDLVADLKASRVLVRASPAASAVCAGCERGCVMPVQVLPDGGNGAAAFIVCDKRSDINRVVMSIGSLEQWKATVVLLADCLARLLHFGTRSRGADTVNRWPIGMLEGKKHKDRLALHAGDCGLSLSVAGHTVALEEVLTIKRQTIWLDRTALLLFVDQPTGKVAAESESADDRQTRLLALIESERLRNPRKFLKSAADREGITVYALKQVIYRKPKAADAMTSMANALAAPVSKKAKRQR